MTGKAVRQYLQHYAEPESHDTENWSQQGKSSYQHVVVIPAYQEDESFIHRALQAGWFRQRVLLIVVINQPDTITDTAAQQQLFRQILDYGIVIWQRNNLTLLNPGDNAQRVGSHILLVDRFTTPILARQGVGLARKIGADLALALIANGTIHSKWICSTDADAILPNDYFSVLATLDPQWTAACYNFKHVAGSSAIRQATKIYEQAMRYYVAGLQQAGSPYAHFTIGSILAFKATAYAGVRGFPRRAAGEDFYLLNKLVKTGTVGQITSTTVQLQARLSERVPFGTGMSAANIMQLTARGKPFCYYHPQTFVALKQVLEHFSSLWEVRHNPESWLKQLPTESAILLLKAGLITFVEKQQQYRSKQQFDRQLMNWFDGLKTLQFIHGLRDSVYPDVPLEFQQSAQGTD